MSEKKKYPLSQNYPIRAYCPELKMEKVFSLNTYRNRVPITKYNPNTGKPSNVKTYANIIETHPKIDKSRAAKLGINIPVATVIDDQTKDILDDALNGKEVPEVPEVPEVDKEKEIEDADPLDKIDDPTPAEAKPYEEMNKTELIGACESKGIRTVYADTKTTLVEKLNSEIQE